MGNEGDGIDMHKMDTRLSLVEQSVVSIKEDTSEIKDMLNVQRKDYVTRIEHDKLEKRVETMDTRFWGLVAACVTLAIGTLINFLVK